jgi:DNA repair protein RAD50
LTIEETSVKEMAKLAKLHLSGIRSFGPYNDQAQQMKFASPLTLILGQNGCGKTTIIEAIKYACTGDLPGGTNSGQGFVNDPKMSRTSSTKGQIKLKLLDVKGNEVTVARVVEVTQTALTMKFNSKSSAIRTVTPEGRETSLNGRCADITSECCQIMNVSPAVLNNVIFCHQENSAWPLDEGKKLKEKFDEIFDAQKYNRCTDVFRKQLETKQDKIKILKLELSYKLEKKQYVEKEKRVLQDKEDTLQGFEEDIRAKNDQLDPIKRRIDEIFALEQVLGDLQTELTTKEATKNGVVEEQKTIKRGLEFEFEGGDGELQNKIKSFEKDRRSDENDILQLEGKRKELEGKSKVVSGEIQEAQTQLGQLNQQKSHYERRCSERKRLLEQAKNKMGVKNLSNYDDNEGAKAALNELKTVLDNTEMSLISLIEEKEIEESALQATIDEARENSVRTTQDVTSKEKEIRESEQKMAEIANELISLSTSDEFLKNYTKRIEAIDKTIFNLNNTFRESEESQKMENNRKEIQTMENKLEELEREHRILQQNDVIEGKMETEKRLIMEKQGEINKIKTKHSASLKQLFGEAIPERNLKESVLTMQKNADLKVKNLTDKITRKQKEVTTLEVQRQNQLEKIATCEKQLKDNREKISQVCNGRDFNETLESTFEKKERLQIDKGQYSSVRIIYGQFVKKFEEESPCCPICETNFSQNGSVTKKIISNLKSKLDKVPHELTRVENELQKEEALYSKLQQLRLVNDESEVLAKEKLPGLKQRLDEIDDYLRRNKTDLEELKAQLSDPQKTVEVSRNVISDVSSLDQNQTDVEKSNRTLEVLKSDLVQVPSNKSKQEVEADIDCTKSEVNEVRRKVDAQAKKINNHRDRLQQLTQERIGFVDKQMRLKEGIQSKPALEAQKSELTEKVAALKEDVTDLKATLSVMKIELETAIKNREDSVKRNKQEVQGERDAISSYRNILQDMQKLQKEIDDYLDDAVEARLAATETKLRECRNKETSLEEMKTKITDAISKKREDLAKQELRFRTLQQNVVLREKKVLETKLVTEIQELKRKIGGYNIRRVYEEKQQLMLDREDLEKQVNSLSGQKNVLSQSIEELRQELNKPENRQAHNNYLSKYYQLKIAEHVVNDLNKYIVALEKAVLEFHKAKMTQINKNIRELWRDIYRGNDIDFIEIKTEYASGNTKKRSYNYKVVQVKKGIELDMRGRCSAGQKVLACLIIRMALAETLSANCGILALDEPTTNLDRENIHSLSDTLAKIVNTRQKEKNFQLLVITHDEEFLNTLTRVQGVSYYYRIQRNDEGFSVIKKEYAL